MSELHSKSASNTFTAISENPTKYSSEKLKNKIK
uniref:Uncharacterized protein n=1 Tax=Anguilla anguilla TaxID=7936 RepID=A0A0E9W1C7_ANGAN